MNKKIKILKNEYWYGLATFLGDQMPLSQDSNFEYQFTKDFTENQENPVLVSSKGRYIYCDGAFDIKVKNGFIEITNSESELVLGSGYKTLKGAFLAASKKHFPSNKKFPPSVFFEKAQYNTWIEFLKKPSQDGLINYATQILDNGFPAGILMLDDGWMKYYGSREFSELFYNVKKMTKTLHKMGFKVMLWVCPFITPDTAAFKELSQKDCLVRDSENRIALRRWWNEESAVLDLSNPCARKWFKKYLDYFLKLGFDGFKFDAGDVKYYRDDDKTYGNVSAHEQCELYAKFGLNYRYNEFRACFKMAGRQLVQRLRDKPHDYSSLKKIVTDTLSAGIIGYAYTCPDMIGGGLDADFLEKNMKIDGNLFVAFAQISQVLPMMQFSTAPWRVLNNENFNKCVEAAKFRASIAKYIISYAKNASKTGEPIIRYMEYEFPHAGFEKVLDQFMIGKTMLCAPFINMGETSRLVKLPQGQWKYGEKILQGGKTISINFEGNFAPIFFKLKV